MIQPVNAVTAPKSLKTVQPVAKISKQNKEVEANAIDKRQNDEVLVHNPTADDIIPVMNKIMHLDKLLEKFDEEV